MIRRLTCARSAGTAAAAFLAFALFVASPLLLIHHHHTDAAEEGHCALCAFVSTPAAPAPVPADAVTELVAVGLVPVADEASARLVPERLIDERAPPTA
jgi:hypothetical protein